MAAARAHVEEGEPERALTLLEGLARRHPERTEIYPLLAATASGLGRPDAAIPFLEEGLSRGGAGAARVAELLGTLLEEAERWDEAEARYREALTLAPSSASSYRKLSRVMVRRGSYAEALATARAGVEAAPADATLRAWLGELLLDRQRYAEAERELRAALSIGGAGAYPHYLIGLAYLHLERPAEARVELEIAVDRSPEVWEGWYQLANACDRLGDAEARDRALGRFETLYRRQLEAAR